MVAAGNVTSVSNTASISSESFDTNNGNNASTVVTTVNPLADLQVTKLCKPDTTIYAGTPISCTIYVDNRGPSDARAAG